MRPPYEGPIKCAHRLLGQVQPLRCPREVQFLGHCQEVAQLPQFQPVRRLAARLVSVHNSGL